MDRAEVRQSVAFQALTPVGRRVLAKIEDEVARNGGGAVALPRSSFGGSLGSVTFGVRQCERLGFVSVHVHAGLRRAHTFRLCDDWKSISADKAARLVKLAKLPRPPQVAAPQPVKPPKSAPTPKPVAPPRTVQQRGVTLPRLAFMDDGR